MYQNSCSSVTTEPFSLYWNPETLIMDYEVPEYILYLCIRLVKKSLLEANKTKKCYVKYVLSIYSIDITQVQQMCEIAELFIEILAKLFLTPCNLHPPYLMPYQAMGPFPHLGQPGHSPQQKMRVLMAGDACADPSLCKTISDCIQWLHGCLQEVLYASKSTLC